MAKNTRRHLLVGASAFAVGAVVGAGGALFYKSSNKRSHSSHPTKLTNLPNILLFVADDMRWDAFGAAGNRIIKTPSLDALASEGTLFSNNFVTTSICPTSRASFLLGQYARRHGVWDFATALSPSQLDAMFPARLRQGSYRTGFIGKWGLGGALATKSFDHWSGFSGQGRYFGREPDPERHLTEHIANQAINFLESPKHSDQPFFLQVSFKAPHVQGGTAEPFQPDPRFDRLYQTVTVPRPPTATAAHYDRLPSCVQDSEGRKRWERRFATETLYQRSVKNYYRLITGLDLAVGLILKALKDQGVDESTVVIFTSDNGFLLGEHGLAGKWWMYEESIRTPLIVRIPPQFAQVQNQVSQALTLNIDIAPTIFELAGLKRPASVQGRSLVPLMTERTAEWRGDFYYEHAFEHPAIPKCIGVRSHRWKLIEFDCPSDPTRLFDLAADPFEENNLASTASVQPVLATLRGRLKELRMAAG